MVARRYLHPLPDGTAALRYYRIHRYIPVQRHPDRPVVIDSVAQVKRVRPRLPAARRQPAYLRAARESVIEPHQQMLALYAERIRQNHELRIVRRRHADHILPVPSAERPRPADRRWRHETRPPARRAEPPPSATAPAYPPPPCPAPITPPPEHPIRNTSPNNSRISPGSSSYRAA